MLRKILKFIARLLAQFVFFLANILPRKAAFKMADSLGSFFFLLMERSRFRGQIQRTINYAFPGRYSEPELTKMARKDVQEFLQAFIEICRLNQFEKMFPELITKVQGLEYLESAKSKGKGVIILSAHIGCWEILAASLPLIGVPASLIGRRQSDPVVNEMVSRRRECTGNRFVNDNEVSTADIVEALKRKENIFLISDHHHPAKRNFAHFFGRLVSVPAGVVIYAQRSGAAVVPAYTLREPGGKYQIIIEPEIQFEYTGNMSYDIVVNTERYLQIFEKWIRQNPEQYLWGHERWGWLTDEELAKFENEYRLIKEKSS